jgi:hypothetical protein
LGYYLKVTHADDALAPLLLPLSLALVVIA